MENKKEEYTIIVDSREQNALWMKSSKRTKIKKEKLDTGDYSAKGYEDKICLERKSLGDLFGSLGKGHKRFRKELERARSLDYFAIIIEGSIMSILNKEWEGSYHTKMRGYVILKILCTLQVKYGIHVIYAGSRKGAKRVIMQLLKSYIKKEEKK